MITLNLTVNENRIQTGVGPLLTSGCVNAVKCVFSFDESWEGLAKVASFESPFGVYHAAIENDACIMPNAVIERATAVYIGVVGTKQDYTVTTDKVRFRISEGANKDGTTDPEYDPTLIEQLLDIADKTEASVRNLEERVLSGDIMDIHRVGIQSDTLRYTRNISITQGGVPVASYSALGRRLLQSWYITDLKESGVSGDFTAMLGFRNYCFGNGNVVCGIGNDITGRAVLAGGINNVVLSCAEGAVIGGRNLWIDDGDVAFALGLPNDGRIIVYTSGEIEYTPPGGMMSTVTITPERMWEVFGASA